MVSVILAQATASPNIATGTTFPAMLTIRLQVGIIFPVMPMKNIANKIVISAISLTAKLAILLTELVLKKNSRKNPGSGKR